MKASFKKYTLEFKQASGTSRGVLHTKDTYFLTVDDGQRVGIGECGLFKGLSADDRPDYEDKLFWLCSNIHLPLAELLEELIYFPSIQFGLEQVIKSFNSQDPFVLFENDFAIGNASIPINGLVWMGDKAFMQQQIKDKIAAGFTTIKMKIGAIDFQTELDLLTNIRKEFSPKDIELRVDANGAFDSNDALEKLKRLSDLKMHSIEQPIKQGQWDAMANLCEHTPLPIALDEELIDVFDVTKKKELLQTIRPQFIILKPSLVGGFGGSSEWIDLAEKQRIGWWITSALESNIGLNAISQFTYELGVNIPQGLGTGSLFTNNIKSPLEVEQGHIRINTNKSWNLKLTT
ncbi:o-succinylbenzoate synthase [Urechidicola sp. KH5]